VFLADEACVALGRLPWLRVGSASLAVLGGLAGTDVRLARGEEVDLFAKVVLVIALGEAGSEQVAALALVAAWLRLVPLAHVGGEGAVARHVAVEAGVAGSVVAGLPKLTKLGHVLRQADSGSPGSVIREFAVHSWVALVSGRVPAGLALAAHFRRTHSNPGSSRLRVLGSVSEEVLAGARLARGEKALVVRLEVGPVTRRVRGRVAASVGLASARGGVRVGLAGTPPALPDSLKIVRVARGERCSVAELVQATGVVAGAGARRVPNAASRGRSAVSGVVMAVKSIVTLVARGVSAWFIGSSHLGGSHAKTRPGALVIRLGRSSVGISEKVLACARFARGQQTLVVGSEVAVVAWRVRRSVATLVSFSSTWVRGVSGFACAASEFIHRSEVVVVTFSVGVGVAELVDVSCVVGVMWARRVNVQHTASRSGRSVSCIVMAVHSIVTGVGSVSAGFIQASHFRGSNTKPITVGIKGVHDIKIRLRIAAESHAGRQQDRSSEHVL